MQATVPALGDKLIRLSVLYKSDSKLRRLESYKVSGEYDSRTFEVRARPTDKVENLRPGMTVLVQWANL